MSMADETATVNSKTVASSMATRVILGSGDLKYLYCLCWRQTCGGESTRHVQLA